MGKLMTREEIGNIPFVRKPILSDSVWALTKTVCEAQRLHTLSHFDPETPEGKIIKEKIAGIIHQARKGIRIGNSYADSILAIIREAI